MFKHKWTTTCLAGVVLLGTAGSTAVGHDENPSRAARAELEVAYTASSPDTWEARTKTVKPRGKWWRVWRSKWPTLESLYNGPLGYPGKRQVREIRLLGPKGAQVVVNYYDLKEQKNGFPRPVHLWTERKTLDCVTPMTFTLSGDLAEVRMKLQHTTKVKYEVREYPR